LTHTIGDGVWYDVAFFSAMLKKKSKKQAPKKISIRLRIIPLALLKKRLAAAQMAAAKFETGHEGQKWSKADAKELRQLMGMESVARIRLRDESIRLGKAKH
jgi:hypothetical protein